jgi:hypothetical protein
VGFCSRKIKIHRLKPALPKATTSLSIQKLILSFDSGSLVVNLYRSSARFIHLLRGVGIEVGNRQRAPNPFRSDVL